MWDNFFLYYINYIETQNESVEKNREDYMLGWHMINICLTSQNNDLPGGMSTLVDDDSFGIKNKRSLLSVVNGYNKIYMVQKRRRTSSRLWFVKNL